MERNTQPKPTGTIFNVMRFCVNDGPGIRATVFLKGCPLRCAWCHNPESQSAKPEVMLAAERCIACEECVRCCPNQALHWKQGKALHDARRCKLCGKCCAACPPGARRLIGEKVAVADLLGEILRDRLVYEESGGGVTFSGGEPLMQPDFLCAMLQACRVEEIHTAVDTCGHAPATTFQRVAELTDLLLFDLKLMSPARHRQVTGAGNRLILRNLELAGRSGRPMIVRIPIIPGVNDDEQNLSATVKFLAASNVKRVDLLPYHGIGREKYRRLHKKVRKEFDTPAEQQMLIHRDRFEANGFDVRIGG